MKTAMNKLQQRQAVVKNTSSYMENGRHRQRNTLEQEAQETIEKCSQEANQKKSKVYRLLTRNKNKKWKDSGSV
jgi:hypothetical protein